MRDGRYEIEIKAMCPQGSVTPETLSFTMDVVVPLPDTVLTETGPYIARDIVWTIPARAVPSEPGRPVHLIYRIDDKEWQPAYKGDKVLFAEYGKGEYRIETAAKEDERYVDRTPLQFSVKYDPDYHRIVEKCLDVTKAGDPKESEQALSELRMIGERIIPVLKERLEEAQKQEDTKSAPVLERLINEIEMKDLRGTWH
jgi:hypothetical protein